VFLRDTCQGKEQTGVQRLGEKLRFLRQQRGMTVRDLAAALGYTGHSHISDIENGKREPRASFILKVALLFGVTTDQLLRDDLDVIEA
jgi:transcriptional regulator with XRE-family HTH domain